MQVGLQEGFMKLTMSYQAPPIEDLLENHRKYKEAFNQPMKLGVKKAISIVTCMDSRVMPAQIFGLDIGDAEYIRNGGGRVTDDVIRSAGVPISYDCLPDYLNHHQAQELMQWRRSPTIN